MNEEITMALDDAKDKMDKAIGRLEGELSKIRAGKAHPSMLESVRVDYYGSMTPVSQVANVNSTDARTLVVQPWEKGMLDPIATGIINANLGLNPMNNGEVLRRLLGVGLDVVAAPAEDRGQQEGIAPAVAGEGVLARARLHEGHGDAAEHRAGVARREG